MTFIFKNRLTTWDGLHRISGQKQMSGRSYGIPSNVRIAASRIGIGQKCGFGILLFRFKRFTIREKESIHENDTILLKLVYSRPDIGSRLGIPNRHRTKT
jgi:hypothetical protein